jgi:drug/metabolite transporter (DMT)-like permease
MANSAQTCECVIAVLPLVLSVISAVFHAGWNSNVKALGRPRAGTMWTLTFALPFAWAAVFVLGAHQNIGSVLSHPLGVVVAGGGEVFYVWSLGQALARGELGVTYAVSRATAMLAVWPLAYVCFGASPTPLAMLASAIVVVGIVLVGVRERGAMHLPYTILSGLGVGIYHTGYKACVRADIAPALAFAGALTIAVPALWILLYRELATDIRALMQAPKSRLRLLFGGALAAGSFVLAVTALAHADSGVVLGLRNSSVGFALLIALWLGERPTSRQWAGIAAFAASIVVFAKSS